MEVLIISIVAFLAALLTFFSGFGLGTILTPVMLIFFPPEIAISLTGIVHFCNNIFKLSIIGSQFNKEVLIKFGIPAVIFAFAGSYMVDISINMKVNLVFIYISVEIANVCLCRLAGAVVQKVCV